MSQSHRPVVVLGVIKLRIRPLTQRASDLSRLESKGHNDAPLRPLGVGQPVRLAALSYLLLKDSPMLYPARAPSQGQCQ